MTSLCNGTFLPLTTEVTLAKSPRTGYYDLVIRMTKIEKQYRTEVSKVLDTLPLTPETPCSYLVGRLSRSKVFRWEGDIPLQLYEIALNKGFRRCGDTYYQFNCGNCQLCLSYRVLIEQFCPTKSQQRVLRRNKDVHYIIKKPEPTAEKEEIYLRYQLKQHHGEKAGITQKNRSFDRDRELETMHYQMYLNPQSSREIEFYLDNRLIGFGIIDVATTSISAVYTVFDPEYRPRSLGTLAILLGIDWAKSNGFKYYYLGFYIPGHAKMDYKKKFGKAEILNPNSDRWEATYPGDCSSDLIAIGNHNKRVG